MKLLKLPFYPILLCLFFVLHAYVENWIYIDLKIVVAQALKYTIAAGAMFALLYLIYKDRNRAALVCFVLLAINFFFPNVHELIKQYSPLRLIGRYSFLLPILIISIFLIAIKVYKSKNTFGKLTQYFNITLLVLILTDAGLLFSRINNPYAFNRIKLTDQVNLSSCDTCSKPDIYFLVFDEYGSSISLKTEYGFENSQLDTFLVNRNFSIQTASKSNYNWTQFSLASMLNMSYLEIPDPNALVFADYIHASGLIAENKVATFLQQQGYQIEAYSIFNFGIEKAVLKDNFAPERSSLITDRTLLNKTFTDIGWNLMKQRIDWKKQAELYDERFENIKMGIDLLKKSAKRKSTVPRFIYSHLLMPHAPFYMDKDKRVTDIEKLSFTASTSDINAYLNYLDYSNKVIKDIVETIRNADNKAVIIFMGDHGFRPPSTLAQPPSYFQNQNAVYYPGKKNISLYDSVSGVNQFRIILNDLFHQELSLLPDKTVFLTDKK